LQERLVELAQVSHRRPLISVWLVTLFPGLIGGGVLGQIVTLLLPSVVAVAQSGNLSIGGIVSQVIAGGAGGAILTALIGAIKNKAAA
jgi:hypothetical protein